MKTARAAVADAGPSPWMPLLLVPIPGAPALALVHGAERHQAHRRLDAVGNQRLECRLAGEAGALGEGRTVMAEGGDPRPAAVVVLAPRHRMELAMPRMRRALGGQRVFVHPDEELHA